MNNDAYAAALAEIEEDRLDKGVWARSFADSGGDESKAKALYIKARAESLHRDEVWHDTRPPEAEHAGGAPAGVKVDSVGNVAQGIDGAENPSDTNPIGPYEAAIGDKSQSYYLDKFQDFDQKGDGWHVSWNWAAFFGGGAWALYRKMYGWFFAWWAVATVVTVYAKVPNDQIHQIVAIGIGVFWLGFTTFANSLYHRKVKARIASAQRSISDASRVSRRLSAGGGVHTWVPIVFGAIPVIGIVAAVALPAYEDHTKRQAVTASPARAPAPEVIQDSANNKPAIRAQTSTENPQMAGPWDEFKGREAIRAQTSTENPQWSANTFDQFDTVNEIEARARHFPQLSEPRAWSAVLEWQDSNMRVHRNPANQALFYAVGTVLDGLKDNRGVCRPGAVELVSAAQASESMPAGTKITLLVCDR